MLPVPATDGRSVKEVQVDNFLVRVFVPADGTAPEGELRGLVRHVASGTETPFRSDEEVLGLLRGAAGPATQRPPPDCNLAR